MSARDIVTDSLLAITALACVVGVLGMWRMRKPIQALQYLALPATIGMGCLALAVLLQTGFGSTFLKSVAIAFVLLGINSVVAHASGRAFRIREAGGFQRRDSQAASSRRKEPR